VVRAAELFLEAGMAREALGALRGRAPQELGAEALLALIERVEAALGEEEAEARLEAQSWRAAALYLSGDSAAALGLARALPLEALEAVPAAFDLLRFASAAALSRGQREEADQYVEAVARMAAGAGTGAAAVQSAVERARRALLGRRAPEEAVEILEEALRAPCPALVRLTAEAMLGVALRDAGAWERSAAHNARGAAEALRLGARSLGHVFLNNQAEALRDLGRVEEARAAYEAALEATPTRSAQAAYARINLATLEQASGLWGQARARLEALAPALGEDRGVRVWLYLAVALQVCEAADGDVARWEAQVGRLEEAAGAGGEWVPEAGALLRRAGALWRAQGHEALAARAEALAARVEAR
jgi:tetratricopeptide (TPR) repeat protein